MSRKFTVAYFVHSLRSDWNNGNAHFLRGLLNSLVDLGHSITVYEPANSWSITNLHLEPNGPESLAEYTVTYPRLAIATYNENEITCVELWKDRLEHTDVVIVHEWNPPELAQMLVTLRHELHLKLLFHDTHHRVSSSPQQIRLFNLDQFDGVLAFGESLRKLYREILSLEHVWTFHEAADTSVFKPHPDIKKNNDVVWVGNWGDGERSAEIVEFLLEPAQAMPDRRFTIYGVRYPEAGLIALRDAGVHYAGYAPNLSATMIYAAARLTVHVPRQQYVAAMKGIPTIRIFEALACGIPLLSAPWEDSEHLFRQGDFLTVRNAGEMRRAMEFLLNDPGAAEAQALRGLETILGYHTCRHRAEQLITIFEELLS